MYLYFYVDDQYTVLVRNYCLPVPSLPDLTIEELGRAVLPYISGICMQIRRPAHGDRCLKLWLKLMRGFVNYTND
jgi:hypothetical protein